jgi:signal transduction histidine kinase
VSGIHTTTTQAKLSHQEQLQRLQSEVEALREQLHHAQRLATVGAMTAMVAHEFNNILTPIISYAQMAQKNPALSDKAVSRAADGGQRASQICKSILDMTREGKKELHEVDLVELVNDTLAAMVRDPKKDSIGIAVSSPASLIIKTKRVELQQVLLNLLINARSAVQAKAGLKRIDVRVCSQGHRVSIEIEDTGIGIPPQNMQRIFEPFFTTKNDGDKDSQGTGLGLAICKDIIKTLGGEISVRSAEGKGTTFTVIVPAGNYIPN